VASACPSGFAPLRLPKPSPPASCGGHIIRRDGDAPSLTLLALWTWAVPNFALTAFYSGSQCSWAASAAPTLGRTRRVPQHPPKRRKAGDQSEVQYHCIKL